MFGGARDFARPGMVAVECPPAACCVAVVASVGGVSVGASGLACPGRRGIVVSVGAGSAYRTGATGCNSVVPREMVNPNGCRVVAYPIIVVPIVVGGDNLICRRSPYVSVAGLGALVVGRQFRRRRDGLQHSGQRNNR